MNKWLIIGHEWFLPRRCLLCLGDAQETNLCGLCQDALPRIGGACSGCGLPLESSKFCGRCLQRAPPFDQVCIPFRYQPPLSGLILELKFEQRLAAAATLGSLLLESVAALRPHPDVILPVPLHPARVRQRGFNQALEIARPLATGLGIRLAPRLVRRKKNTLAQSSLEGSVARRRNLRGAFHCDPRKLAGVRRLAIVDDVVTTCATAAELARTLKRAGVPWVELWSVARASGR